MAPVIPLAPAATPARLRSLAEQHRRGGRYPTMADALDAAAEAVATLLRDNARFRAMLADDAPLHPDVAPLFPEVRAPFVPRVVRGGVA